MSALVIVPGHPSLMTVWSTFDGRHDLPRAAGDERLVSFQQIGVAQRGFVNGEACLSTEIEHQLSCDSRE